MLLVVSVASEAATSIRVIEPTGVHRDRAPVHTLLQLAEPVAVGTPFRLTVGGIVMPAQFRPANGSSESASWWLDFFTSCGPRERREFLIEYGPEIKPSPEQKGGHQLHRHGDRFVVSHAPHIDWTIPRDLAGFLRSVEFHPHEHLRPDSPGFFLEDRDGKRHRLGGENVKATVLREGRTTVALRFECQERDPALRGVRWSADLIFPGGISWVDVQLDIADPEDRVAAAKLDLNLVLDPPTRRERTLVEFGADRTVYRSLGADDRVALVSDVRKFPAWQINRTRRGEWQPFVVAAPNASSAEGWAHIMDRKRCLAIAFDGFGHGGEHRIELVGDGKFKASRRFAKAGPKQWRTWLHFVQFPPRQSANSDPHMMQNPLRVTH